MATKFTDDTWRLIFQNDPAGFKKWKDAEWKDLLKSNPKLKDDVIDYLGVPAFEKIFGKKSSAGNVAKTQNRRPVRPTRSRRKSNTVSPATTEFITNNLSRTSPFRGPLITRISQPWNVQTMNTVLAEAKKEIEATKALSKDIENFVKSGIDATKISAAIVQTDAAIEKLTGLYIKKSGLAKVYGGAENVPWQDEQKITRNLEKSLEKLYNKDKSAKSLAEILLTGKQQLKEEKILTKQMVKYLSKSASGLGITPAVMQRPETRDLMYEHLATKMGLVEKYGDVENIPRDEERKIDHILDVFTEKFERQNKLSWDNITDYAKDKFEHVSDMIIGDFHEVLGRELGAIYNTIKKFGPDLLKLFTKFVLNPMGSLLLKSLKPLGKLLAKTGLFSIGTAAMSDTKDSGLLSKIATYFGIGAGASTGTALAMGTGGMALPAAGLIAGAGVQVAAAHQLGYYDEGGVKGFAKGQMKFALDFTSGQLFEKLFEKALEKYFGQSSWLGSIIGDIWKWIGDWLGKIKGAVSDTVDTGSNILQNTVQKGKQAFKSITGLGGTEAVNVQQDTMKYLMSQGASKEQAAGVVGNLMVESYKNIDPNAVNPSGHKGIAQWDKERYAKGEAWAKVNNKDFSSRQTQLEYMVQEAKQRGDWDKLLKAQSPEEAAKLWNKHYEGAAGQADDARMNNASSVYKQFKYGSTINDAVSAIKVADNCGDAVARAVNPLISSMGGKTLPLGGLGQADITNFAKANGVPTLGRDDLTLDNLRTPGTIVRMTRQPGDKNYGPGMETHAEMSLGDKMASYTAGVGWRYKDIDEKYLATLPKQITAVNPFEKFGELPSTGSQISATERDNILAAKQAADGVEEYRKKMLDQQNLLADNIKGSNQNVVVNQQGNRQSQENPFSIDDLSLLQLVPPISMLNY